MWITWGSHLFLKSGKDRKLPPSLWHGFSSSLGEISEPTLSPSPISFLFLIALQYCVGFCRSSTYISHWYTCVPSLLKLPPFSLPIPPLQVVTEPQSEFLSHPANSHWLSMLHMIMYVSVSLSPYIPPSPSSPHPHSVHKTVLYVCVFTHFFVGLGKECIRSVLF